MTSIMEEIGKNLTANKAETNPVEPKVEVKAEVKAEIKPEIKEEVKAEVKAEPVKAEAPETTESKEQVKPDYAQALGYLDADDTPETESKEGVAKIGEEKPNDLSEKAKWFDELTSDPIFKAMAQLKKEGKSLTEFAKELYKEDLTGKSDKELYEAELKAMNVSDEDMEVELSKFDDMSLYQKKKIGEEIRNAKDSAYNQKISQYSYSPEVDLKFQEQAQQAAAKELSETLGKMSDQYYYGLKMTPEILSEVQEYVVKNARVSADGKSYDIRASIEEAVFLNGKLRKKLLKANVEMAKTAGYDEAISERNRPSKEEVSNGTVSKMGVSDAVAQFIANRKWG